MTGPVDGTTDCPVLVQSADARLPSAGSADKRPTFQGWLSRQNVWLPRAGSVDKRLTAQGWLSRQTSDCPGLTQPTKRQTSQDIRSVNPFLAGGCLLEISEQEFYVVIYPVPVSRAISIYFWYQTLINISDNLSC